MELDSREQRRDQIQHKRVHLDCDVEAEGVEDYSATGTGTQRRYGYPGEFCVTHRMRGWFQLTRGHVEPSMGTVMIARDNVG